MVELDWLGNTEKLGGGLLSKVMYTVLVTVVGPGGEAMELEGGGVG